MVHTEYCSSDLYFTARSTASKRGTYAYVLLMSVGPSVTLMSCVETDKCITKFHHFIVRPSPDWRRGRSRPPTTWIHQICRTREFRWWPTPSSWQKTNRSGDKSQRRDAIRLNASRHDDDDDDEIASVDGSAVACMSSTCTAAICYLFSLWCVRESLPLFASTQHRS